MVDKNFDVDDLLETMGKLMLLTVKILVTVGCIVLTIGPLKYLLGLI